MGPIRVVRYNHSSHASFDNRRLYWAREQQSLDCLVLDANDPCQDDEDMCVVSWEATCLPEAKEVHEAHLQALDYHAWIAFRCARQGATYPLEGDETVPKVQSADVQLYRKNRASLTSLTLREELSVDSFNVDLAYAIESGECILNGNVSGGGLYFNEHMRTYLISGNANVKVVRYYRYPGMTLKAMAENRDEWDAEDWGAYEKERVFLMAMGREDDGGEESYDDGGKPDEPEDTMRAPHQDEVRCAIVHGRSVRKRGH